MLNESQRAALEAFCDTIVPSIERADDPYGPLGPQGVRPDDRRRRSRSLIAQIPDEVTRGGLLQLLDVLDAQGLGKAPSQLSREQILRNISFASPDGAAGIGALIGDDAVPLLRRARPADRASNPNWETFGYPGPPPRPTAGAEGRSRRPCPRTARASRPTRSSSARARAAA